MCVWTDNKWKTPLSSQQLPFRISLWWNHSQSSPLYWCLWACSNLTWSSLTIPKTLFLRFTTCAPHHRTCARSTVSPSVARLKLKWGSQTSNSSRNLIFHLSLVGYIYAVLWILPQSSVRSCLLSSSRLGKWRHMEVMHLPCSHTACEWPSHSPQSQICLNPELLCSTVVSTRLSRRWGNERQNYWLRAPSCPSLGLYFLPPNRAGHLVEDWTTNSLLNWHHVVFCPSSVKWT